MNSITAAASAAATTIVISINLANPQNPEIRVETQGSGLQQPVTAIVSDVTASSSSPDSGNNDSVTSLDFPPVSPQRSVSPGASSRSTLNASRFNTSGIPLMEPLFEDDEEDWQLIFEDNFKEVDISTEKWTHEISCDNGRDNNEAQYYTHAYANTKVNDNTENLLMVAREEWNNSSNFAFDAFDEHIKPVSSAHLTTKYKFDFQYGRVCIKGKMPGGRGLWPQLTLLPIDPEHGNTAEIKVMEFMSISRKKYSNNLLKSGIIYGGKYPNVARAKNKVIMPPEEHPVFYSNEYCADWRPERITWTVNGKKYAEKTQWHGRDIEGHLLEKPAPFNEPFYLSLKVAVGVNWVSKFSRGATSLPSAMEVEHVKVWQKKN